MVHHSHIHVEVHIVKGDGRVQDAAKMLISLGVASKGGEDLANYAERQL